MHDQDQINMKAETSQVEFAHADDEPGNPTRNLVEDAAARGQGLTGYEELTWWEAVKLFKMNALICFAVTFSAATDGYQIG